MPFCYLFSMCHIFLVPQFFHYCILLSFFFFFIFIFFLHFCLCWVFVAAHGLSLVAASGDYSSVWCTGFSLQWLLLLLSMGSRCTGFSSCGLWAQYLWLTGSRLQAQ